MFRSGFSIIGVPLTVITTQTYDFHALDHSPVISSRSVPLTPLIYVRNTNRLRFCGKEAITFER